MLRSFRGFGFQESKSPLEAGYLVIKKPALLGG
jgi:hypothetical protein